MRFHLDKTISSHDAYIFQEVFEVLATHELALKFSKRQLEELISAKILPKLNQLMFEQRSVNVLKYQKILIIMKRTYWQQYHQI